MKTWQERMAGAAKVFSVTPEEFETSLASAIGITPEMGIAALDDEEIFKFGDFREAFKSRPIATLRIAFRELRAGRKEAATSDARLNQLREAGFKVRIEDADPAYLLGLYDPNKPNDPVALALKKRYGDRPVLAFRQDGSLAIAESLEYAANLEQQYPEQDSIMVDGKLARLWPVGRAPDTLVDEDPLFPGKPLRNGYSTVNHCNWKGIPGEKRQMCRIIVERGEIDVNNRDAVLRLMERAVPKGGLSTAYPEAELEFDERQKRGTLPQLKVELGTFTKPANPFGMRRQY